MRQRDQRNHGTPRRAPLAFEPVEQRGPLDLQADVGNKSVARLLVAGDGRTPTALANRSAVGNQAIQRLTSGGPAIATATVTSTGLNVRSGPSASTAKVGQLLKGQAVEVVSKSGVWLRVRFDGGQAWISSRFVKVTDAPAPAPAAAGATADTPAPATEATAAEPAATAGSSFLGAAFAGASSLLDDLRAWWGSEPGETTAAGPTTTASGDEKTADAAADVAAPTGELDALLSKDTLSPEEINTARTLIDDVDDEQRRGDLYEALQAKTQYRSQRDNEATTEDGAKVETASGNMCNLTSLAMSLSYLGVANPRPEMQFEDALEKIRQEKGFGARTTADGWGKLANELGVTYEFLGIGVTEGQEWWAANVRPALRQGMAVMLSISGHICRLQAVTEEGLVADDPYGASKLLAGGEHKWKFTSKNKAGDTDAQAGNNVLWPWADVAQHTMKWVAGFKK